VNEYEAMIALAGIIAGTVMFSSVVFGIVKLVSGRKQRAVPDAAMAQIDARLSRIEQAIDAVAVEVERVSEAQRFTTRLLNEGRVERT
jgi:hypothetical protein